ncbi:50S ribosomal protein L3 [Candidatus Shapirobacteria bacterium]|nr:50S ribosomal protein L3 [Candidatus Shapirobacteria bacterium]
MINGYIAQKSFMTSVYTPEGKRIAVTTLNVTPLSVTQVKTLEKDKYSAVQISYGTKKKLDKKEFDLVADTAPAVGDKIDISLVFAPGDELSATGTSKGRGFAGVIKRYGFQRQPVSGGQSDRVRAPGAIGAQTPGKVLKGKKMPGHYGNKTKTISGLKIIAVNTEKQQIFVSGSVPGHFNSWVTLSKTK